MSKAIYKGKEYALATKTMAIARMIEAIEHAPTVIDVYEKQWEFIAAVLGADVVRDIFGTADIEAVDLNLVTGVYNSIIAGYDREIMLQRRQQEAELLNTPTIGLVKDLAADMRTIGDVAGLTK